MDRYLKAKGSSDDAPSQADTNKFYVKIGEAVTSTCFAWFLFYYYTSVESTVQCYAADN